MSIKKRLIKKKRKLWINWIKPIKNWIVKSRERKNKKREKKLI